MRLKCVDDLDKRDSRWSVAGTTRREAKRCAIEATLPLHSRISCRDVERDDRILGSYPYYEQHEYRYWPHRTVACATKGHGRVPASQADPIRCHSLVWDRHRNAVLVLLPELAQMAVDNAADYRFGCAGLDTYEVEIEGADQGVRF